MSEYIVSFDGSENLAPALALAVASAGLKPLHEEIVRCRDCIKFGKYGKTAKAHWCGYWTCYKAKPDGFYAWAERKVDA